MPSGQILASEKATTVRVAYYDMGDYYSVNNAGTVESYDTEMLKKISEYSNFNFEFVDCKTWANALVMLKEHKVDLVGTVQWTSEREDEYEFCLESYGYTVGELASLSSSKTVYEDYDAIGKSTIGMTYNYVRMDDMKEVFKNHNISPKIKTYATQQDLETALESGEVDIVAANSHTLKENWKVLEKFSYSPYYFVSYKGNSELTDKIDDTIIKINLREPDYDDNLIQKYFPNILGAPLTKEELNLIAENKSYIIYYSTDAKPLSWYDKKSGEMKGALVDACKQIKKNTGLNIEVRPKWEMPRYVDSTTIKFTTIFSGSNVDLSNESGVTDALINESFNLFHRTDNKIDINNESYSIGIVGNRNKLKDYVKELYPNCDIVSYDSPAECIKHVESGDVDLTYLDIHIADNVLTETGYDDIRELPLEPIEHGIGIIFEGKDAELLESIVDKGITQLDQTEISDAMVQYALQTQETFSIRTILRDYLGWFIATMIIIILVIMAIVSLVTYAGVMKKQKNKVEKADADKAEFFSRMSHDMRTPMNGILGMVRLSKDSSNIPEIHDNMGKAEAAGEYMLSLINDTLDLQKLENKKMKLNLENVYAKDFFDDMFSMMKISAEDKGVLLRITNVNMDMNKFIEIDKIRVRQIFSNLLSNAIKFTPKGGTVEVVMECLGQNGDFTKKKFQVRDTGVGMSKEFIEKRMFKPYSQENNEITSQLTGTGLGLAITKNLVEIMGGHIEVESELGEGTTFTFSLDFKNVSNEDAKKVKLEEKTGDSINQASLDGKRILLCEDHPLNAEIAKRLLAKVGCETEWAENGAIGLETFSKSEENYFDMILMDIRMPVMNGFEATREIRALDRKDAKKIPIIAMTANAYEEDIKNSLNAGMNAHLAKPIEPNTMYNTISKYLPKKQIK